MSYLDLNLSLTEEDIQLREAAHKFAKEVMRPIARELDLMSPEEALAEDSPLWEFMRKAYELGYHKIIMPEEVGGLGATPLQAHIVFEELGWGSFGLAVLLAVAFLPFYGLLLSGNQELIEKFTVPFCACDDGSIRGCWAITEPDHGSDAFGHGEEFFESPSMRANVQAQLEGDEWVINGQKAAWVSGACTATHVMMHPQIDQSRGMAGFGICIVPLDLEGVTKGKPLKKVGQRDLNQGELFFDNVRIPKEYMFIEPEAYHPGAFDRILAATKICMSIWSTGLARAAYDEALEYAKERVQGGKPLIEHYAMRERIFNMFARVETCRALSRAVTNFNLSVPTPFSEYSAVAKTICTQKCFENAHEAVQILGGNGLTEEYLTEKLFRDARATLIEDGNNEVLAREGGFILSETYPRSISMG